MHPLATKLEGASPLMGLLKIDQLAFLAHDDHQEDMIKRMLRLTDADWVEDVVRAEGTVQGYSGVQSNTAKLLFNYDLGLEVEILRYTDGPNYADVGSVIGGRLCHVGMHVEKGQELPENFKDWVFPANIIQQVETKEHSNQFLIDSGRRYRYTIYDTRALFGVYLKVIERLEAAGAA